MWSAYDRHQRNRRPHCVHCGRSWSVRGVLAVAIVYCVLAGEVAAIIAGALR